MQRPRFVMIEEKVFRIEFFDSEEARMFYNRANERYGLDGDIDKEGNMTVIARFSDLDLDKAKLFKQFIEDERG